jgi:hypothetical protein
MATRAGSRTSSYKSRAALLQEPEAVLLQKPEAALLQKPEAALLQKPEAALLRSVHDISTQKRHWSLLLPRLAGASSLFIYLRGRISVPSRRPHFYILSHFKL